MLKVRWTPTALLNPQRVASRFASPSLASKVLSHGARPYATEAALPSTSSANPVTSAGDPEGALRPRLGVEVNPNHGLWAFFRKTVGKDGMQKYEALEKKDEAVHYSGRAWSAAELRRKSFKDLHTLWYVVLRERNLLETQSLEAKRLGIASQLTPTEQRMYRCRKTMARIKYVINERRLTYEGAVQIIAEGKGHEVLGRRDGPEEVFETSTLEPSEGEEVAVPPVIPQQSTAERAAAGLLQPDVVRK